MARTKKEALKECPLCTTEVEGLVIGLRDFRWINSKLPGRIGGADIDFCLEQHKTGRLLVLEFKPNSAPLPLGQRWLLQWFYEKGADVWVVDDRRVKVTFDEDNKPVFEGVVLVGHMQDEGLVRKWKRRTVEEFGDDIVNWWEEGFEQ